MGSKPPSGIIVNDVAMTLQTILPNIDKALDGTGFVFGAGSSFEAGYPLVTTLTKE